MVALYRRANRVDSWDGAMNGFCAPTGNTPPPDDIGPYPPDEIAGLMADLDITREEAIALIEVERQEEIEREARGSCAKCKHYTPDPEAGRRYFGEPNADSGWCKNPSIPSGHRDYPHADMLSGDWCQKFEARP